MFNPQHMIKKENIANYWTFVNHRARARQVTRWNWSTEQWKLEYVIKLLNITSNRTCETHRACANNTTCANNRTGECNVKFVNPITNTMHKICTNSRIWNHIAWPSCRTRANHNTHSNHSTCANHLAYSNHNAFQTTEHVRTTGHVQGKGHTHTILFKRLLHTLNYDYCKTFV